MTPSAYAPCIFLEKNMIKRLGIGLVLSTLFLMSGCCPRSGAQENIDWLYGTWEKTSDEDGLPSDKITFKDNGAWISYGRNGQETTLPYHLDSGNIYLTILPETQEKGPVAMVFKPNHDGTTLIFTSPRTGNNATYERIDRNSRER